MVGEALVCALALWLGVANAVRQDEADDGEGDHPQRPLAPVCGILRFVALRESPCVQERHGGGAQIDGSVDDADGDPGVLGASEVHGHRAREHAVDADDGERHEDDDPHQHRVADEETHDERSRHHAGVEHGRYRSAARLEQVIGDRSGEHPSQDARTAQEETPVLHDEDLLESGRLAVDVPPLHNRLPEEARAELDRGDRHDDRVLEHHREHTDGIARLVVLSGGGVSRQEVSEARLSGAVADDDEADQENDGENGGRDEEDELDLSLEDMEQKSVPVVGEVDTQADQDPEDTAEHAALVHVEPGCVSLDDGNGAERLEVHVDGVEDGERWQKG